MTFNPNRVRTSLNARASLPPAPTIYANTPMWQQQNEKEDFNDFFNECLGMGCVEVTLEVFDATLLALTVREGNTSDETGKKECLEVLEDYCHACVADGRYWIASDYLGQFGISIPKD